MHLNFHQFADCMLRIALYIYSKPEYTNTYRTTEDKIEAMFESWSYAYDRTFGISLESEKFDLNTISPPSIHSIHPVKGSHSGGETATIYGKGFDFRLGGVFVQFGSRLIPVERNHTSEEVRIITPKREDAMVNDEEITIDVEVTPTESQQTLLVDICKVATVGVFVTNCAEKASKYSHEKLAFDYVDRLPPFEVGPEIVVGLDPIFKRYCKINDPYNNTFLSLDKYKVCTHNTLIRQEVGML